uniref:Acyl-coenzyme A oxidase n=1 Tax=Sphenodon punctatus TaxID=8508 RepID=A0A8D0GEF7_SPHPU
QACFPNGRGVNPDLDVERKAPSFSVERLTTILDEGAQNTKLRREVEKVILSDPAFSRENQYFQTPPEQYETAVRKSVHLKEKLDQLGWAEGGVISEDLGFNIHTVFKTSIWELGTSDQIAKWIPLADKYHIVGTYAQTELGHGTYLRGLETTATFEIATQEFVLNTPRISAMKWWPGDLGRSATHAVVLAQLYIKGKCYGMHPFFVPIRSLQDGSPRPGVLVGDIGPKMGMNHIDNGFLMLHNVRIPRENMLGKFSQVLPDGSYVKQGSEKINYLTMIVFRVTMLAKEVLPALMKACTIAIRYAVVRRQSELKPGDPEAKVLDFQTQQQKLLPQLASAYAFHFIMGYLDTFYSKGCAEIKQGKFDSLPELHALASVLKAVLTDRCAAGVEVCRRACGGHGYSLLSGLPSLYCRLVASCTYEGENTVMLLQAARFLIRCFGLAQSGQPLPPSVAYLSSRSFGKCAARDQADFLNPDVYTGAYKHRASRSGRIPATCPAHCYYIIVENFVAAVEKLGNEAEIQRIMKHLCDLFALNGIFSDLGDFLHDGYLSEEQADMATASYLDLLAVIRKDAVPLVDAFDFSDGVLNSALGSYDGQVYQRLYEWAQKSPANTQVRAQHGRVCACDRRRRCLWFWLMRSECPSSCLNPFLFSPSCTGEPGLQELPETPLPEGSEQAVRTGSSSSEHGWELPLFLERSLRASRASLEQP